MNKYALYKGDELLDMGTLQYLSEKFKVKIRTLLFYQTPSQKKRTSENRGKRLVKLRDEEC